MDALVASDWWVTYTGFGEEKVSKKSIETVVERKEVEAAEPTVVSMVLDPAKVGVLGAWWKRHKK